MATAVVMETVDYYLDKGRTVYSLAWNATKAFDRVEYTKLFESLIEREVNIVFECVKKMDYQGHTITNDRSDSLVDAVSKYFNIQFNL